MKKYNNYTYISPSGIINEVKRRLNTYFASGQLDESMMGIYVEHAVRKLGVGALDKTYAILKFIDYKSQLPDDFFRLNVAYRCDCNGSSELDSSSVTSTLGYWSSVTNCESCSCTPETQTFETLKIQFQGYKLPVDITHPRLLRVGISKDRCVTDCKNLKYDSIDEIQIGNHSITSNFKSGVVFFSYYTMLMDEDETGYPMIIDEIWFTDYVRSYIMWQCFCDLLHIVSDETANQIMQKHQMYKQEYDIALINAKANIIAPTKMQLVDSVKRSRDRNNIFNIK